MNRPSKILLTAAFLGTLAVGSAFAEDLWVKSESVEIREGKGAVYPVITTVKKGQPLTVIERDGKWIKVKAGDKDGYVYETAVSPTKIDGGGNIFQNMGIKGSGMTSASAAKGLDKDAEAYASGKGMSPRPLQTLVDAAKKISPKEWEAFAAEGKVGPYARK